MCREGVLEEQSFFYVWLKYKLNILLLLSLQSYHVYMTYATSFRYPFYSFFGISKLMHWGFCHQDIAQSFDYHIIVILFLRLYVS